MWNMLMLAFLCGVSVRIRVVVGVRFRVVVGVRFRVRGKAYGWVYGG
jgi:hypothetical protein